MTGTENVNDWLQNLEHPLKTEIEAVRKIIIGSDGKLSERVKWAAPSFYYKQDLVTFNHRNQEIVQLVFHHAAIVQIQSGLLEGKYKDRRLAHFKNMADVREKQAALEQVMRELVGFVDNLPSQ